MNLVIDVGNSTVKLGVFDHGKLIEKRQCEIDSFQLVVNDLLRSNTKIDTAISSNVANRELENILDSLLIPIIRLNYKLKFPYKIAYNTPETLGVDRLALAAAAFYNYPQKDVLVIDAGTCITYDIVNASGVYLGGSISPGLQLRYKSLHEFTSRLPLLSKKQPHNLIGSSTTEAIHNGVVYGIVDEIDGQINRFVKQYPDLTVILTGGDCNFLSNQLKNTIFANSNFLLEGLNHILDFNRT